MFLALLSLLSFLIIGLSILNIKWGSALFLVCTLVMPDFFISLGDSQIGKNVICVIVFFIFLFKCKMNKFEVLTSSLHFVLIYFLCFLLLIPIETDTPYAVQFRYYFTDLCSTLLLSVIINNIVERERKAFTLYRNILIGSIIVATVYGIILIFFDGINPYVFLFATSSGDQDFVMDMTRYFTAEGEGRIFGRISSVCYHPMRYAYFLGLSLIFVYYIKNSLRKPLFWLLISLISINAVICGVRTVIAALFISAIYYVLFLKKLRMLFFAFSFLLVAYSVVSLIPNVSQYLSSIIPSESTEGQVSGSSLEMRIEQLEGSFDEVGSSIITGKGYGWNKYYISKHGDHPVILSFESLLFIIICNGGILGIMIWIFFIALYLHYCYKHIRGSNVHIFISLLVYYLSFSVITGEYGYMEFFVLFYILMLHYNIPSGISKRIINE